MSSVPVDQGRRRFLTASAAVVGGAGVAWAAVPFISSLFPNAQTLAEGAPVDVDVSKLKEGQLMTILWQKKPVWILYRSEEQLATLHKVGDRLKDPDSTTKQEPEYLVKHTSWQKHPWTRSIRKQHLVVVSLCTHLQCIPDYRPEPGALGPDWLGGFHCPCHGSKYDLSGRVMKGSPAPLNLPVPPHFYKSDTLIRVGVLETGEGNYWAPNTW